MANNKLILKKQGLSRFSLLILMLAFGTVGAFFISRSFAVTTQVFYARTCDTRISSTICGGAVVADGNLSVRRLAVGITWGYGYRPVASGSQDVQVCFRAKGEGGQTNVVIKHPNGTTKTATVGGASYSLVCSRGAVGAVGDTRIKNNGTRRLFVDWVRIETFPRIASLSVAPANEAANLQLINSLTATRNTTMDNNPRKNTPSAQLSITDPELTVAGNPYGDNRICEQTGDRCFRTKCEFSHFAYDDPLVAPNRPGAAHLHMFFGNTQTNAFTTYNTLLNSGTSTCTGFDLNRTAYWVPAMLNSRGDALIPDHIIVYYKTSTLSTDTKRGPVMPYPEGLGIIAGNPRKTTAVGRTYDVGFICNSWYNSPEDQTYDSIPQNCTSEYLEMRIRFPYCWNPAAGTYRQDQSHVAFPAINNTWVAQNAPYLQYKSTNCVGAHSVVMPSIEYRIWFRIPNHGTSTNGWFLSSDVQNGVIGQPAGKTLHGDWWGGWNRTALDLWVRDCNNAPGWRECMMGNLGNSGRSLKPNPIPWQLTTGYSSFDAYTTQRIAAEQLVRLCPQNPKYRSAVDVAVCATKLP